MISVIILASGKGERSSFSIPKQFININNKRMLDYSVQTFRNNKLVEEIVLVINKEWVKKIQSEYKDCTVVAGGKTRSQSSFIGIKSCSKECSKVLIHDSARPFINERIINECIKNIKKYDCVVPTLDVVDSIINEKVEYLKRENLKILQTPQSFDYKSLLNAYKQSKLDAPDDLAIYLKYNINSKIKYIKGSKKNYKITSKDDIRFIKELNEI